MTPEELLKPRYKVKAIWPDMADRRYFESEIIVLSDKEHDQWYAKRGVENIFSTYFDHYPHLFQKLEWWQERKPEEMPEYVKTRYGSLEVKKVKGYVGFGKVIEFEENEEALALYWLPATLEEYNAYQSSIKGK